ncbi:MAG: isocyanide synthase family protein [Candidatus Eremiobacteraeota bacterium]|nr:isocyanide synthase family protein [Candidatus Eremiobacteraeota bacterium]
MQVITKEISQDQIILNRLAAAYNRVVSPLETATAILREVLQCRRGHGHTGCTADAPCADCMDAHLSKIMAKIEQGLPVTFVLPAFPGKSPNLGKVLGTLPDMAERRALQFLQQLAERIGRIYEPGAHIILASDGRVFSDVVGMRDEDVSAYRDELRAMISEMGLDRISTFNLEELYTEASFDEMRSQMMDTFGPSIEAMRASVKRAAKDPAATDDDRELHRLYCGITRFLVEDASFPGQTLSRNAIQKEARVRAYNVIQRSQAWSGVVEQYFPEAVRLSIHPHGCGSKKLGIHFIATANGDNWMTPWHAVALETEEGFMLVRRSAAEEMGARIVHQSGRPSHYTLVKEN